MFFQMRAPHLAPGTVARVRVVRPGILIHGPSGPYCIPNECGLICSLALQPGSGSFDPVYLSLGRLARPSRFTPPPLLPGPGPGSVRGALEGGGPSSFIVGGSAPYGLNLFSNQLMRSIHSASSAAKTLLIFLSGLGPWPGPGSFDPVSHPLGRWPRLRLPPSSPLSRAPGLGGHPGVLAPLVFQMSAVSFGPWPRRRVRVARPGTSFFGPLGPHFAVPTVSLSPGPWARELSGHPRGRRPSISPRGGPRLPGP